MTAAISWDRGSRPWRPRAESNESGIRSESFSHCASATKAYFATLWVLSLGGSVAAATEERVVFNRDVRPILSDTCFHCHGFDPKSRKAGLRLDLREQAIKKTDNGIIPIVPGNPAGSAFIERVFSSDPEDVMPPVKAHK